MKKRKINEITDMWPGSQKRPLKPRRINSESNADDDDMEIIDQNN